MPEFEFSAADPDARIGVILDRQGGITPNDGGGIFGTIAGWFTDRIMRVGDYYIDELTGVNQAPPPPYTPPTPAPQPVSYAPAGDAVDWGRIALYGGVALGVVGLVLAARR